MAKEAKRATKGQIIVGIVVIALILIGIADSMYLLDVHITHKLGQEVSGFCDINEEINCMSAVDSPQSSLFGVPVPVYAIAFYGALLLLTVWAVIRRRRKDTMWDFIVALFVGGIAYSFYLLYILIFELDAICPGCLVLDVVNILGLVLAFFAGGLGVFEVTRRLPKTLLSSAGVRNALAFGVSFALVFVTGTLVAKELFRTELERRAELMLVDEEEFRNLMCGTELWSEDGPATTAPVAGNEQAQVVILDFSDFECPYCARLEHTFAEILEQRGEHVQIRFLHYPLNQDCNPHVNSHFHPQACDAAVASVCAHEQGRFWEYHDLLYANSRNLSRTDLDRYAVSLDMDMNRFRACMDSEYTWTLVRNNAEAGHRAMLEAGVGRFGTPFFFVNGLPVRGARPKRLVDAIIDAALEALTEHIGEERATERGIAPRTAPAEHLPSVEQPQAPSTPTQVAPEDEDETGRSYRPAAPVREYPGRAVPE